VSGRWWQGDASSSAHGEMKCISCGKLITEGEYRYRQKSRAGDWHYQSQHRACSESDPAWVELDACRSAAITQAKELSRACRDFKTKWDVEDLNDYIRDDDGTQPGEPA